MILSACPAVPSAPQPRIETTDSHEPADAAVDDPHDDANVTDASIDGAASDADAAVASSPHVTVDEAEQVLFPVESTRLAARNACEMSPSDAGTDDESSRIRCLIRRMYSGDGAAAIIADGVYVRTGTLIGVESEQDMDGGYRGLLHLVPEPAIGTHRTHLQWLDGSTRDLDAFFAGLERAATSKVRYRWKPLLFRVFRSVNRHTPAAYANGWTIAYNVAGSLNTSADAVRETMFHEIFHLNDAGHDDWSHRVLASIHASIVARCGTKIPCLQPFAPNDTTVRGGTYYAFQPGNDEREYAAELAIRYYREHREKVGAGPGRSPATPFKCGPAENARSWALIRDEFFGGVDLTPPCK